MLPGFGQKLVNGVEEHRLEAGATIEFLRLHRLGRHLHHPVGARVAIHPRQAEQMTALVEQPVVHAPSIHRNGNDRIPMRGHGAGNTGADVGTNAQQIPVPTVRQEHAARAEARHFLQRDLAVSKDRSHDPAAFGAEVDGEVDALAHEPSSSAQTMRRPCETRAEATCEGGGVSAIQTSRSAPPAKK